MRADGRRNRQRLIEAAKDTFYEQGPQVSLDTIARRAGVGIGTLYRHFPVRDALIEAVCRAELEQLAAAAKDLLETHSPGEALRLWMHLYVEFIATNKLMAAAVSSICGISPSLYRSSVALVTDNPLLGANTDFYQSVTVLIDEAAGLLLDRSKAAGEIHAEIDTRDFLRALGGFTVTYGDNVEGWEDSARRLIDIFVAGLRAK